MLFLSLNCVIFEIGAIFFIMRGNKLWKSLMFLIGILW